MVPDQETSEVVQKIFEYAVNGMNAADIARELSRQQIPTPGEHKARKGIKTHDVSRTHGMWCNSTVLRILADERYMGTYVIGKREVTEIGGHKMRSKAESDWIKIPNHHIPLVNEEIFSKANALFSVLRFQTGKSTTISCVGRLSVDAVNMPCTWQTGHLTGAAFPARFLHWTAIIFISEKKN
mgnify:CR=1 FL=1